MDILIAFHPVLIDRNESVFWAESKQNLSETDISCLNGAET